MKIKKYFNYILVVIISLLLLIFIIPNFIYFIQNKFEIHFIFNFIELLKMIIDDKNLIVGILIMECLFILFLLYYKYNFKIKNTANDSGIPKRIKSNEFGSSDFASLKEIKENFSTWHFGKNTNAGGMVVAIENNKYYVDTSSNHTLVVGSTGSGKTVGVIFPLIYNLADNGESMIINDVKGEIYKTTYDYLKKKDYDIQIINLRDTANSSFWNPLEIAYQYYKENNFEKDIETVNDLSSAICEDVTSRDKYWQESSSSVLSALCLALIEDAKKQSQIHFHSIYNLLVEHGSKKYGDQNSLDKYFNDRPFGNTAKNLYASGNFARGETRATIFSILASKLRVFGDTGVSYITSKSSFNIRDIGKKKTAIFLIVPDEKLSRHFIGGLFVNQVYQTLVEEAQKNVSGSLPIRVNFILDEFCNTIKIGELSKKLTVARSRKIRFYMVVQDYNMLNETYKETAGTIKANAGNTVYLLTNDYSTAREISNRMGKYTTCTTRTSTSNRYGKADFNISSDTSLTGRDLRTPDELMNIKVGEAIILRTRMSPIKTNFKQLSDYPIKYKVVEKIVFKQDEFHKLELFDLDTFRIEQELFSNSNNEVTKTTPTKKANPTKRKKKDVVSKTDD